MTTELQNVALSSNWLECSDTTASATVTDFTVTDVTSLNWVHPFYTPWTTTTYTHSEITLKMSEVERLRMAAREDKKLKKILEKFTPYIKVVVDFD